MSFLMGQKSKVPIGKINRKIESTESPNENLPIKEGSKPNKINNGRDYYY